jgi:hypothetical protein
MIVPPVFGNLEKVRASIETWSFLLVVPLAGCMSLSEGASRFFSARYTCPAGRLSVVKRNDLPPRVLFGAKPSPPPAEVAADPERMKLWRQNQADTLAALDDTGTTYEVDGCGRRELLICAHPLVPDSDNGGYTTDSNDVTCVPGGVAETASAGITRLEDHYDIPPVPETLRGLRMLVPDGCTIADLRSFLEHYGWTGVKSAAEPHDVAMSGRCNVNMTLLPSGEGSILVFDVDRPVVLRTPGGEVIASFEAPDRYLCPGSAQTMDACTNSMDAYLRLQMEAKLLASPTLADLAARAKASRQGDGVKASPAP